MMRIISVASLTLSVALLLVLSLFFFNEENESFDFNRPSVPKELPKSAFAEKSSYFQEADEGLLALNRVCFQMQLPDLRSQLIFSGKNERPDSRASCYLFTLRGSDQTIQAGDNEKVYLIYKAQYQIKDAEADQQNFVNSRAIWGDVSNKNESNDKCCYSFSPGNAPSSLWFIAKELGDQRIEIKLYLLDEKATLVAAPQDRHTFTLAASDTQRGQTQVWEVGSFRADPTLLVRQRARWIGSDLFLETYGGEEYQFVFGKERIDFQDGLDSYSCYVKPGDFLVWLDGRWRTADVTKDLPLLVVKKVEEKIMSFELWNKEGTSKLALTLLRSKDNTIMPDMNHEFKFVGAKTLGQFIVETRTSGRMILKPHDWLVMTDEGWIKLDSADKIDAYVDQIITGPLFVLEKMCKKNGKQVLVGSLFNSSRTELQQIELSSTPANPLANYHHMPQAPALYARPNEWMEGPR